MLEGRVILPVDKDARELPLLERVLEQELARRAADTPAQVAVCLLYVPADLFGVQAITVEPTVRHSKVQSLRCPPGSFFQ